MELVPVVGPEKWARHRDAIRRGSAVQERKEELGGFKEQPEAWESVEKLQGNSPWGLEVGSGPGK